MVGGVHGQVGHHVLKHVVLVKELDSAIATILPPHGVENIVLMATPKDRVVTLQNVQVRLLRLF